MFATWCWRSNDGGKTFSQPVRVAVDNWVLHACPDVGPTIGVSDGRLYVAWYSEGQEKPGIRLAIFRERGSVSHVLRLSRPTFWMPPTRGCRSWRMAVFS